MRPHVNLPRPVEAGRIDPFKVARHLRPGVIVQDVDPAQPAKQVGDQAGERVVVGDVHCVGLGPISFHPDCRRNGGSTFGIAVDDHHMRTLARHHRRARAADAGATPVTSATRSFRIIYSSPKAFCFFSRIRRRAAKMRISEATSTAVATALISGVTPRRIEANT